MDIETGIEHVDLDTDEDEGDEPQTLVYMAIVTADGMRYIGSAAHDGEQDVDTLAEMLAEVSAGAAAMHSSELATRWAHKREV